MGDEAPSQHLCRRCQGINLQDVFSSETQSIGINGRWIGLFDTRSIHPSCELCRMFTSICPNIKVTTSVPKLRRHHLRAFAPSSRAQSPPSSMAVGICDGHSRSALGSMQRRRCISRGLLRPVRDTKTAPQFQQAELIDRDSADFKRMASWLSDCKARHGSTCQAGNVLRPFGMKLIDTATRRIVSAKPEHDYFALSYVWGASRSSPRQVGCELGSMLPDTAPKVIEDALAVVQSLDGRYLWVDQYCIDQEDSGEKHLQISGMDKIYEGALATIVAAFGDGADAGLPGVSCRRLYQPRALFGNLLLASTFPHLSFPLIASVWASRAWTFQETACSKRCFFFTKRQVYFSCMTAEYSESLSLPIYKPRSSIKRAKNDFRTDLFDIDQLSNSPTRIGLGEFFDALRQYKRRSLTYDTDALNAFQGILNRSSYLTIWGVPVCLVDTVGDDRHSLGFAIGLWWENPGWPYDERNTLAAHQFSSFRRRTDFPSWSWAGWDGPIMPHASPIWQKIDKDKFDLKVLVYHKTEDRFMPLADIHDMYAGSTIASDLGKDVSPVLQLDATIYTIRIRKDDIYNSSVAYACSCPSRSLCDGRRRHVTLTNNVRFFEYPRKRAAMGETFFSVDWDAVKLFVADTYMVALLLIQWDPEGDTAEAIGVAYVHRNYVEEVPGITQDLLPKRRQIVRLK